MKQQKKNSETNSFPGIAPMAGIDGAKIRKLREEKGVTQLYLSTVVGVTTDTISRWENKRYPSIKLENAEKLAQALQVELEAILEEEKSIFMDDDADNQAKENTGKFPGIISTRHRLLFTAVIALISILLIWVYLQPKPLLPVIRAARILPLHVPPGQSFPVLVEVTSSETSPASLILKEVIPSQCTALNGIPTFTAVDPTKNILKWISRTTTDKTIFTYMAQVPQNARPAEKFSFNGYVTLKQGSGNQENISGSDTISIDYYHWADTNRDNRIDDEEILAVYDNFSEIPELPIDIDLIDSIWAGNGYYWDMEKKRYVLKE